MFSDTDLHRLHVKCCDKSVIISITSCTQISFGTSKNNYITFGTYGSSRIHIPDHYNTCIRFQTLSGAKCSTVELSISLSSLINHGLTSFLFSFLNLFQYILKRSFHDLIIFYHICNRQSCFFCNDLQYILKFFGI